MKTSGFTLLEVLIAGSLLFIVGAAVVGLTNSIIQGTIETTDKTVMNRWATEGLEMVEKIRDDNVLSGRDWLTQAVDPIDPSRGYGWYIVSRNPTTDELSLRMFSQETRLLPREVVGSINSERDKLVSNEITGYRLICLESFAARQRPRSDDRTNQENQFVYCNANDEGGSFGPDGSRRAASSCTVGDGYCQATKQSINRNRISNEPEMVIPAGNAVRVRSLVIWQIKDRFFHTDIMTLLTNWQWSGNVTR